MKNLIYTTPEEFREAVDSSTRYLVDNYSRLQMMEKEYNRLLELIKVIVEQDFKNNSVVITVSKQAQMVGNTWRDILEYAIDQNKFAEKIAEGSGK